MVPKAKRSREMARVKQPFGWRHCVGELIQLFNTSRGSLVTHGRETIDCRIERLKLGSDSTQVLYECKGCIVGECRGYGGLEPADSSEGILGDLVVQGGKLLQGCFSRAEC
jgi:hypothetical protein